MIGLLTGKIISIKPGLAIVEVNGVGYEVLLSNSSLDYLRDKKDQITLYIQTQVSETSFSLYGFLSELDKSVFKKLISISGIGPKLGLQILSGMSANELIHAIMEDNLARLTSINGIGKKTAARILVELKDKLSSVSEIDLTKIETSSTNSKLSSNSTLSEASLALMQLGYNKNQVDKVLGQISLDPNQNLQDIIKESLKRLSA